MSVQLKRDHNHGQLESNLKLNLPLHFKGRGCRVYPGNIRVKVPAAPPYRYADLTILCDKPIFEEVGGIDALTNPTVIVEILSPATEAFDRGDKFSFYKSIPSFREYLLVAQHRTHITHFCKQADGRWKYEEVNDITASVSLASVDCTLALSEVYADVEFESLSAINMPTVPPVNTTTEGDQGDRDHAEP